MNRQKIPTSKIVNNKRVVIHMDLLQYIKP